MFTRTRARRLATVLTGAALAGGAVAGTTSSAASAAAAVTPPSGFTQLATGAGGRLEVAMASTAARQPIVNGRPATDSAYRASHWAFVPMGQGYWRISNRASTLCLEAANGGTAVNTPLVQNACGAGFAQQFSVRAAEPGYVTLHPRVSEAKAVSAFFGFSYPGAPFVLDTLTGSGQNHQKIRFMPAS